MSVGILDLDKSEEKDGKNVKIMTFVWQSTMKYEEYVKEICHVNGQ